MFQTNQPSSDRSLHALLGIGLLHLHPTAHVRTLLPWSQRCRVPVAEGHNLMTPCRTEKVDFSKKIKKKTESPKKNKSTGRITRRNKKQEKQNKNKKKQNLHFPQFLFCLFLFCFFLFFPWFWFSSLFFLFALVLLFFCFFIFLSNPIFSVLLDS